MLKSAEQSERVRRRGRGRWALLLLVPPVALLVWALVGMHLLSENQEFTTAWRVLGPNEERFGVRRYGPTTYRTDDGGACQTWGGAVRLGYAVYVFGYASRHLPQPPGTPVPPSR